MRAGGGKAKGAAYEREICRRLSIWISHGEHEDVFWRASMSGGRATVARKQGRRLDAQQNDLSAIRKEGIPFLRVFTVECKHVKDLKLISLFYGTGEKGETILGWWNKLLKNPAKKEPILICKQNRHDILFCTTLRGASILHMKDEVAVFPQWNMHIYTLDDFIRISDAFTAPKPVLRDQETVARLATFKTKPLLKLKRRKSR